MSTSVQRAGHSNWLIGGIAIFAVIAFVISLLLGLGRYRDVSARVQNEHQQNTINAAQNAQLKRQQERQAADERCTANYNATVNRRNQRVEGRFEARDRAQHTLTILQLHSASTRRVHHAQRVFLYADRLYLLALHRNPIPVFRCASHNVGRTPRPRTPRIPGLPARPSTSSRVSRPSPTPGRRTTAPKASALRGRDHGLGHRRHHPRRAQRR